MKINTDNYISKKHLKLCLASLFIIVSVLHTIWLNAGSPPQDDPSYNTENINPEMKTENEATTVDDDENSMNPSSVDDTVRYHTNSKYVGNQPYEYIISPPVIRPISLQYRLILAGAAIITLFCGILICRTVNIVYQQKIGPEAGFWLYGLFGLFGGIAALFVAAATMGYLYLHLASTVCIIISGFCIGALLPIQFVSVRSWIIGHPQHYYKMHKNSAQKEMLI